MPKQKGVQVKNKMQPDQNTGLKRFPPAGTRFRGPGRYAPQSRRYSTLPGFATFAAIKEMARARHENRHLVCAKTGQNPLWFRPADDKITCSHRGNRLVPLYNGCTTEDQISAASALCAFDDASVPPIHQSSCRQRCPGPSRVGRTGRSGAVSGWHRPNTGGRGSWR